MICSWLNHQNNIGVFFVEQARIFKDEFAISLINFKYFGIRDFIKKRRFFHVECFWVHENQQKIYYVYYPKFKIVGKKVNQWFEKTAVKKAFKKICENNQEIDLIHCQSLLEGYLFTNHFSKLYNIPYILTEHNQLSFFNKSLGQKKDIENFLKRSKANLVVSFDKMRQFISNGLYSDYNVIGNMVVENIFFYKPKFTQRNICLNKFEIITIGSFTPLKDQITLLKALKDFEKEYMEKEILFIWIGFNSWGKDNSKTVNTLIKDLNFEKIEILLIPECSREDVAKHLQSADLFIFSSICEGMPVSVLEALACGTPVISTNCGGVDEVINESNGRLVQIKDYLKLKDYIHRTFTGELYFDNFQISKDAHMHFGSKVFKKKLIQYYEDAIKI